MRRTFLAIATLTVFAAVFVTIGSAWQAASSGPYKILKTVKTGGLGGFDYIYADVAGRRLYIPRSGSAPNATPPLAPRITVFDLDTLASVGEVRGHPRQRSSSRRQIGAWLRQQQTRHHVRHEDPQGHQEHRRDG